jgi:hypothetical protein
MIEVEILCEDVINAYFVVSFITLNYPEVEVLAVEVLANEGGLVRIQCEKLLAYQIASFIAARGYTNNINLIDEEEIETAVEINESRFITKFLNDKPIERESAEVPERPEPVITNNHIRSWISP